MKALTLPLPATIRNLAEVTEWWRLRCIEGTQLPHKEEFIEGWDYFGGGPWFVAVAAAALRAEYVMWAGSAIRNEVFHIAFHTVAIGVDYRVRRAVLRREDGTMFVKTSRRFYVFGDKPVLDMDLRT